MSDDLAENNMTVATDQKVWQAWLAKNRAPEERLDGRMARIALVIVCADNLRGGLDPSLELIYVYAQKLQKLSGGAFPEDCQCLPLRDFSLKIAPAWCTA